MARDVDHNTPDYIQSRGSDDFVLVSSSEFQSASCNARSLSVLKMYDIFAFRARILELELDVENLIEKGCI
jgi:hypothetical protein